MVHRSCSRDKLIHPGVIHRRDVFLPELGGVLGASNWPIRARTCHTL